MSECADQVPDEESGGAASSGAVNDEKVAEVRREINKALELIKSLPPETLRYANMGLGLQELRNFLRRHGFGNRVIELAFEQVDEEAEATETIEPPAKKAAMFSAAGPSSPIPEPLIGLGGGPCDTKKVGTDRVAPKASVVIEPPVTKASSASASAAGPASPVGLLSKAPVVIEPEPPVGLGGGPANPKKGDASILGASSKSNTSILGATSKAPAVVIELPAKEATTASTPRVPEPPIEEDVDWSADEAPDEAEEDVDWSADEAPEPPRREEGAPPAGERLDSLGFPKERITGHITLLDSWHTVRSFVWLLEHRQHVLRTHGLRPEDVGVSRPFGVQV